MTKQASLIGPMQVTRGGPVLMLQIENEYGRHGNDKSYLEVLSQIWTRNGIDISFYTADGATPHMLEAGNIEGAAIGLYPGSNEKDFEEAKKRNPMSK